MPRKKVVRKDEFTEKLEYLGLDLQNIPSSIKKVEKLGFKVPRFYNEKQYKQYKYVLVKDIQILLSPTNRLDDLETKYKKASPFIQYLDDKNEDNIIKYTTFLNMLRQIKIEDIEKVEEEQEKLSKNIPFRVKFEGNYLWQIYYSESTDKYFMIVPTEDSDYSTFFYLLKKKLENKKTSKIFVPIRNVEYSQELLKKTRIEDIENYLWLFTKDWPSIYEVYNKKEELSIQIIGETYVYDKIKSPYRIKLKNKVEANEFYKLLKALFILQSELPAYFTFRTNINAKGSIDFFYEDQQINYESIFQWINIQYKIGKEKINIVDQLIKNDKNKLEKLKIIVAEQEIEYLAKEKQISTFLECKKSFFGKFKYYFKYNKQKNRKFENRILTTEKPENINSNEEFDTKKEKNKLIKKENEKENYNIEELIEVYKDYQNLENKLKNILMDINALKLKNKNMKKKIENATLYIQDIDDHKKSIFEFWKYSNKDEVATLGEGEEEEVNIIKKITKVFDFESDFDKFGKSMDKIQAKNLSEAEKDSVYVTTTNLLGILNKIKNNEVLPKEITTSMKEMKEEKIREKELLNDEEFDIFGGKAQDMAKISKIGNVKHRENHKDMFNILDLNKSTKTIEYKFSLEKILENIKRALTKVSVTEDLSVYKAILNEKINEKNLNIFNIDMQNELKESLTTENGKITLYKINLKRGTNAISYTNCIFYDNQNQTLPLGQDISTKILIDVSKFSLRLKSKGLFKMLSLDDEKQDFPNIRLKTINVFEYDVEL